MNQTEHDRPPDAGQAWQETCPLCGRDNQCALAAGREAGTCWCASVTISADALAAVPAASVGKRCLCPACGQSGGAR